MTELLMLRTFIEATIVSRLAQARRSDERGAVSTEYVILGAIIAAGVIAVATIVVAKIVGKANSIPTE
jgi:Flp pilus assembly pilin Flp